MSVAFFQTGNKQGIGDERIGRAVRLKNVRVEVVRPINSVVDSQLVSTTITIHVLIFYEPRSWIILRIPLKSPRKTSPLGNPAPF
jgi:hypothetical protein